jgi:hypothetical protein
MQTRLGSVGSTEFPVSSNAGTNARNSDEHKTILIYLIIGFAEIIKGEGYAYYG